MEKPSNIAVFIDFENFSEEFDAKRLISKLKEKGRILLKRAYADWGRFARFKRSMLENSIELIELPSYSDKGKNSSDIKLVVDALEIAFLKDYIDTFVVVSGDSDFSPLISKLRELNKYVIVIGNKKNMSGLLIGYCDEIHYYNNFVGDLDKEVLGDVELSNIFELITRTINALNNLGTNTLGSRVKQYMQQQDPTFDEKRYGFNSLRELWAKAAQNKIIKYKITKSGDFELSLYSSKDSDNQPANTPTPIISKKDKDIMYFLYWTIQLFPEEVRSRLDINQVASGIRKVDPDFSLSKYGFTSTSGFKGVMTSAESKGFISLSQEKKINNIDYFIEPTKVLIDKYKDSPYPANFEFIKESFELELQVSKYKRYLKEKGYSIDLDKIVAVYIQSDAYLYDHKDSQSTIHDLIQHSKDILSKFNEQQISSIFNTMADAKCILGTDGKPIIAINSTAVIQSLEFSEITIQKFLSNVLIQYFGEEDIDARKLQFLFYKDSTSEGRLG